MWLMCSSAEKASPEKVAKGGRKQTAAAGDFRCKSFRRCLPEATVKAEKAPLPDPETLPIPRDKRPRPISRESSVSTRAPTESSVDSPTSSPTRQAKQVDKARLDKNLRKVRKHVRDVVGQLNHFQVWVKKKFNTPAAAFIALVGDAQTLQVELHTFLYNIGVHGFKGNAEKVFYGLCDEHSWSDGLVITRDAFTNRLKSMGCPMTLVVRQAMAVNRKKIQQSMMKKRKINLKKEDIEQLIFFRNFIEPLYKSPEQVFDAIAGDDGCIDEEEFTAWLRGHNFPADAKMVFHCFCDQDGGIARMAFSEMMVTCRSLRPEDQGNASEDRAETKESGQKGSSEDDAKENSQRPKWNAVFGRARTLSLDPASQKEETQDQSPSEQAKTISPSEQAKAIKAKLSRGNTSVLDPGAVNFGSLGENDVVVGETADMPSEIQNDDPKTADTSKEVPKPSRNRRRSNSITSITSMDGDQDDLQKSEKSTPKAARNRRRSNSITSMDGDQDEGNGEGTPLVGKRKSRRSNSITSMDGDNDDASQAAKYNDKFDSEKSQKSNKSGKSRSDKFDSEKSNKSEKSDKGASRSRRRSNSITSMDDAGITGKKIKSTSQLLEQLCAEEEDDGAGEVVKRKSSAKSKASKKDTLKKALNDAADAVRPNMGRRRSI